MALTPRQRQFYEALVMLYSVTGRSVHYSAVAEALGVSPFSAYDMLKVLECKGAVSSEYVLESATPGPGRSAIRFYPRPGATGFSMPASCTEEDNWLGLQQKLLQHLREVRDTNVREVLNEILGRLSEYDSPLDYCAGVITALLVNLRGSGQALFSSGLQPLQTLISGGELGLGTLAGLSIGASLDRLREASSLESLLQPARRFQFYLSTLSEESRHKLLAFLGEALSALRATQA